MFTLVVCTFSSLRTMEADWPRREEAVRQGLPPGLPIYQCQYAQAWRPAFHQWCSPWQGQWWLTSFCFWVWLWCLLWVVLWLISGYWNKNGSEVFEFCGFSLGRKIVSQILALSIPELVLPPFCICHLSISFFLQVNKTPLRPADPTRLMNVGPDFTPSYLGNLGSRSVGGPRGPVSEFFLLTFPGCLLQIKYFSVFSS